MQSQGSICGYRQPGYQVEFDPVEWKTLSHLLPIVYIFLVPTILKPLNLEPDPRFSPCLVFTYSLYDSIFLPLINYT